MTRALTLSEYWPFLVLAAFVLGIALVFCVKLKALEYGNGRSLAP